MTILDPKDPALCPCGATMRGDCNVCEHFRCEGCSRWFPFAEGSADEGPGDQLCDACAAAVADTEPPTEAERSWLDRIVGGSEAIERDLDDAHEPPIDCAGEEMMPFDEDLDARGYVP